MSERYVHRVATAPTELVAIIRGENRARRLVEVASRSADLTDDENIKDTSGLIQIAYESWLDVYQHLLFLGLLEGPYRDKAAYARFLRLKFMSFGNGAELPDAATTVAYGPNDRLRDFLWSCAHQDWIIGTPATRFTGMSPADRAYGLQSQPTPLDGLLDNFMARLPDMTQRVQKKTAVLIPADLRHLNDPRLVPWLDGILADQIVEFMTPREVKTAA